MPAAVTRLPFHINLSPLKGEPEGAASAAQETPRLPLRLTEPGQAPDISKHPPSPGLTDAPRSGLLPTMGFRRSHQERVLIRLIILYSVY